MNDFEDDLLTITWGKQLPFGMHPGYAQQVYPVAECSSGCGEQQG